MFEALLSRGYFPKEIPHPFNTDSLAQAITAEVGNLGHPFRCDFGKRPKDAYVSKPCTFNLIRNGSLRRTLSIPNPINFIQLVLELEEHWADIQTHLNQSSFTSAGIQMGSQSNEKLRAFGVDFQKLDERKVLMRGGYRYMLKADISAFYPSIYTHSIPWALHTKAKAKRDTSNKHLGNRIDMLVRNAQDKQTKGIPISPDTSLIIAEIILSSIDVGLASLAISGIRMTDDYEMYFHTSDEANFTLHKLQEYLIGYELDLNNTKTTILSLPDYYNKPFISQIKSLLRNINISQKKDLIYLFDQIFHIWNHDKNEPILKYAISQFANVDIAKKDWQIYESLLISCIIAETGTLGQIIDEFKKYMTKGYLINKTRLQEVFGTIVKIHAKPGHSSEVSMVIWGSIILDIPIDDETSRLIATMEDSVIALLALDAKNKGIISCDIYEHWVKFMKKDELKERHWLLAYEAAIQGWLYHQIM